jgi:hypothetical protein
MGFDFNQVDSSCTQQSIHDEERAGLLRGLMFEPG